MQAWCHLVQPSAGDGPIGIALAQTHQDLSILEHLESPAGHRFPSAPGYCLRRLAMRRCDPRCPALHRTGSNTPKHQWLHSGENRVAPICRKLNGSLMPKGNKPEASLPHDRSPAHPGRNTGPSSRLRRTFELSQKGTFLFSPNSIILHNIHYAQFTYRS